MGRKRKELLSSAPWRTGEAAEDEEAVRLSREGKVSVTNNPGETATMNVPRTRHQDLDLAVDDFEEEEIDPELRYSFQRNSRVWCVLPSRPCLSVPIFSFHFPPFFLSSVQYGYRFTQLLRLRCNEKLFLVRSWHCSLMCYSIETKMSKTLACTCFEWFIILEKNYFLAAKMTSLHNFLKSCCLIMTTNLMHCSF
jgi:hypothetical protein